MVRVEITKTLLKEIYRIFGKKKALEIINLFKNLEQNPRKGKTLAHVGKIVLKELKYETFRFYFITDGFKLKFLKDEELKDLVLKFIRVSKKNNQQEVVEEIKNLLKKLGYESF